MRISGSLAEGSVVTLLRLLGRNRASGVLHLHSPGGEAAIWVSDGKVVRATSATAQALGRLLIERGHVDETQVNSALIIQQRSAESRKLGSILVGLSMVEQPRVGAAHATGIRTAVCSIFDWSKGSYEFDPAARVAPDELFEGLDVEALVEHAEMR